MKTLIKFSFLFFIFHFYLYAQDVFHDTSLFAQICIKVGKDMAVENAIVNIKNNQLFFLGLGDSYVPRVYVVTDQDEWFPLGNLLDVAVPNTVFNFPIKIVKEYPSDGIPKAPPVANDPCYYDPTYITWYNTCIYNYLANNEDVMERFRKEGDIDFVFPLVDDRILRFRKDEKFMFEIQEIQRED